MGLWFEYYIGFHVRFHGLSLGGGKYSVTSNEISFKYLLDLSAEAIENEIELEMAQTSE